MKVLLRLARQLHPYRVTLAVTTVLIMVRAAITLAPPVLQGRVVDEVIGARDLGRLWWLVGLLLLAHLIDALNGIGEQYLRHAIGERFIFDLRVRLYGHLQRLSLSFFERTSTGELISRVSNDVAALEQFVTHGVILTIVDAVRLAGAAVVLMAYHVPLALVTLAPVPIIAAALRYFNRYVRPIYRNARDRLGDVNARLQDDLAGIRVIQAFGQEAAELERFRSVSETYYRERVRSIRGWSTFFPAISFLAAIGSSLVLAAGASLVVGGQITLGTLVTFLSFTVSFYDPIRRLTEVDNTFQQAIAAAERVFELEDQQPEIQDAPGAHVLSAVQGDVLFERVCFAYGDGEEVLHDVTFHMAPGEVVALVGPSGAGKSSIANLLCRFYDPAEGRVLVDGHDLQGVQIDSLRRHVAVVLQDTFLFNASVRANLLYGKPGATDDEMQAAAKAAFAHDFVTAMPRGYETEIGERGVKLSGGQRQRLALARAILADPRILILDEATSSVDAEAEFLIQQALEKVLQGRTALVIAHRLSTIRNADKIIALEGGRIREVGDHVELLARGGLYSQLYQRQLELGSQA